MHHQGKDYFDLQIVYAYIDTIQFNILSMQRLRAADFIPVYNEIPSEVAI